MNIEKSLSAARKEWERQMAIEKAATPGPWMDSVTHLNSVMDKDLDVVCECCGVAPMANVELVYLSRNLNPARLRVAERLLTMFVWATIKPQPGLIAVTILEQAAALLGVEVVQ